MCIRDRHGVQPIKDPSDEIIEVHLAALKWNILQRRFGLVASDLVKLQSCLLYTSDAADDLLCVDLGGRRRHHRPGNHEAPWTKRPPVQVSRLEVWRVHLIPKQLGCQTMISWSRTMISYMISYQNHDIIYDIIYDIKMPSYHSAPGFLVPLICPPKP